MLGAALRGSTVHFSPDIGITLSIIAACGAGGFIKARATKYGDGTSRGLDSVRY